MKLEGRFWITHNGKNLAGQGRIELLSRIAGTGSISQAAKAMGMSYKSAWDAVDAMNNTAGSPLVERSAGGKGGGGTRLTETGEQLINAFQRYQEEHRRFLDRLSEDNSLEPYLQIMERLRLRTSARNQLFACVRQVKPCGLNDRIDLELQGGQTLSALITHTSTERLGLQPGDEVFALLKASWVRLAADGTPSSDEANALAGVVRRIEPGELETETLVELLGGDQLTALSSSAQLAAVPLAVGGPISVRIGLDQIILCRI